MIIIFRITDRCNFNCEFCSYPALSTHNELTFGQIKQHIDRFNPKQIFIEGGEPLCCSPLLFERLLEYYTGDISITSNLWDFYKRPDKWVNIFKHPSVDVCTSFQYGTKRKIGSEVYSERLFRMVEEKFTKLIGYTPGFISVIDNNNQHYIKDTINLAKSLGVSCKLNRLIKQGRATESFPLHKMFEHYANIVDAGDIEYELNTQHIVNMLLGTNTAISCPYNAGCENNLVSVSSDNVISNCHVEYARNRITNTIPINPINTIQTRNKIISPRCLSCDSFKFCNNCRQIRSEILSMGDYQQTHCSSMKSSIDKMRNIISNRSVVF
jgi:sulfatase maturation enzyme AslB (radical SAM superfamily)